MLIIAAIALVTATTTALDNQQAENLVIGSGVPCTTIEAAAINTNGTFEGTTPAIAAEATLVSVGTAIAKNADANMANTTPTTAQETTGNTAANTVIKTANDTAANLANTAKPTTAQETTGNTAANTVIKTATMAVFAINSLSQNKAGAPNIAA
jgi:hypothetical protein